MKRVLLYLMILGGVTVSGVWAEQPTGITLYEGVNEISVSVVNSLDRDVTGLTIKTEQSEIPEWLTVDSAVTTISVGQGGKGADKLVLTMTVNGAPNGAESVLPFTLKDTNGNSWTFTVQVSVESETPSETALYGNFPNPFNPSTTIRYSLSQNNHTELAVFNSVGQKIRTLVDSHQTAGMHTVHWNGCNDSGQRVSSGVYFYRLLSGTYEKTKKMILFE